MDPKETTIPAVLVGVGIAMEVAHGVWTAGAGGAGIALAGVVLTAANFVAIYLAALALVSLGAGA